MKKYIYDWEFKAIFTTENGEREYYFSINRNQYSSDINCYKAALEKAFKHKYKDEHLSDFQSSCWCGMSEISQEEWDEQSKLNAELREMEEKRWSDIWS